MAPLILLLKVWIERAMLFNSQGRKLLVSVEVALGIAGYSAADYGHVRIGCSICSYSNGNGYDQADSGSRFDTS